MKTKEINGTRIEAYELNDKQFENACKMIVDGSTRLGNNSIEDSSDFVDVWFENTYMDEDYKNWLNKCVDEGADIYTYNEGWQPISEIAVFN